MDSGTEFTRLTAADFISMPWKNGGGLTRQLAIWPPGASLENFDWRISSAYVSISGPFSKFPGVDRSLAVIDGGVLALQTADDVAGSKVSLQLARDDPAFSFRGESSIDCAIAQGTTVIDLNVMTRRSRFSHRLTELTPRNPESITGSMLFLYGVDGYTKITDNTSIQHALLAANELVVVTAPTPVTLVVTPTEGRITRLWCIEISPVLAGR